jgi:hypothetical protein
MYGTPNEKIWPGITKLPEFKLTFPQFKSKGIANYCTNLDEAGLDLLSRMVVYDPCRRISAKAALNHVNYTKSSLILMIWIRVNSFLTDITYYI